MTVWCFDTESGTWERPVVIISPVAVTMRMPDGSRRILSRFPLGPISAREWTEPDGDRRVVVTRDESP